MLSTRTQPAGCRVRASSANARENSRSPVATGGVPARACRHGRLAAAQTGVVEHVVVDERRGVHELDRDGRADHAPRLSSRASRRPRAPRAARAAAAGACRPPRPSRGRARRAGRPALAGDASRCSSMRASRRGACSPPSAGSSRARRRSGRVARPRWPRPSRRTDLRDGAGVDRDDASGGEEVGHSAQARLRHHPRELCGRREALDGVRQVGVGVAMSVARRYRGPSRSRRRRRRRRGRVRARRGRTTGGRRARAAAASAS